jgi:hypothetical protein
MDIEENKAADAELKADLERLKARINEIDQEVEDLSAKLESLQIQRKRYDSLRGHFDAVLNRKEILENETFFQITPPEHSQPRPRQGDSLIRSGPHESRIDELVFSEASLSERDYDPGKGPTVRGKGDSIAAAVFDILKEREYLEMEDRPLHYRQLVQEIENRGIYISGRDPGLNMIAHIHKDQRFHRPKRGFYGLTEWYPGSAKQAGERTSRRNSRR